MSAPDRRLRNRILVTIRRDVGRPTDELAAITETPEREVRSACWAMYAARVLDNCVGYFVLSVVPRRGQP